MRQTVDTTTGDVSSTLHINTIVRYLDDNVELAKKHTSLTWGDHFFTVMPVNTITELTQANSFLDATGDLTNAIKELVLEQMHSKFLGHHLLELLSNSVCQAIEHNSDIYTWSTLDGINNEIDGLMLLALIIGRIHPNFKVDMYMEIGKVKKHSFAQHDNEVQLFFDAAKYTKLQIDQKDPTEYTEDAFICNIFLQFKHGSLPSHFRIEFSCQETNWMMNKMHVTLQIALSTAEAKYIALS
jgi:hypothetical protein